MKEWAGEFADAGKHGLAAVHHAFFDRPDKLAPTMDAPAPTLAERLGEWAEKHYTGVVGTGKHELLAFAEGATEVEHDLAEARAGWNG